VHAIRARDLGIDRRNNTIGKCRAEGVDALPIFGDFTDTRPQF
jgi:hypothetical protein